MAPLVAIGTGVGKGATLAEVVVVADPLAGLEVLMKPHQLCGHPALA